MKDYEYDLEKKSIQRIILKPSTPDNVFIGKYYSLVSCPIVTTVFINKMKFSFLTQPVNNIKNFFLRRGPDLLEREDKKLQNVEYLSENLKFDTEKAGWEEVQTNYKIPREKMSDFILELNYILDPLKTKMENIQNEANKRKQMLLMIAVL